MPDNQRFPHFVDERGTLTAVEFDDVPFVVRRSFVVHGADPVLPRGDHGVPCEEFVVLLSGSAVFRLVDEGAEVHETVLGEPGASLLLRPGAHVSYVLDGPASSILVLASEPYAPDTET